MATTQVQENYAGKLRRSGEWMSGRRTGPVEKRFPGARALVLTRDGFTCQRAIREIRDSAGRLLDVQVCGADLTKQYLEWTVARDTAPPLHAGHIVPFEANATRGLYHRFDFVNGVRVELDDVPALVESLRRIGHSEDYLRWILSPEYEPAYDVDCMHAECWVCNRTSGAYRNARDVELWQMDRARNLNDARGIGRWYQRPNQRARRVRR